MIDPVIFCKHSWYKNDFILRGIESFYRITVNYCGKT